MSTGGDTPKFQKWTCVHCSFEIPVANISLTLKFCPNCGRSQLSGGKSEDGGGNTKNQSAPESSKTSTECSAKMEASPLPTEALQKPHADDVKDKPAAVKKSDNKSDESPKIDSDSLARRSIRKRSGSDLSDEKTSKKRTMPDATKDDKDEKDDNNERDAIKSSGKSSQEVSSTKPEKQPANGKDGAEKNGQGAETNNNRSHVKEVDDEVIFIKRILTLFHHILHRNIEFLLQRRIGRKVVCLKPRMRTKVAVRVGKMNLDPIPKGQ